MRTFDLSPLFRSSVGFDSLSRLVEHAQKLDENAVAYPPYNIEKKGQDTYRITMAVAGFGPDELTLTTNENNLIITGRTKKDEAPSEYLHRGIAARTFERRFQLADHIKVTGAKLEHGLLHVDLVREVPEAMKPRQIKIETGAPTVLTQDAA